MNELSARLVVSWDRAGMFADNNGPMPNRTEPTSPVALLAFGIDNLSELEELFGTGIRMRILDVASTRMERVLPRCADVMRTAHHRILVRLPSASKDEVAALVERVQGAVALEAVETDFGPVAITVSAGCAFEDGAEHTTLSSSALHALHTAIADGVGAFRIATGGDPLLAYRSQLLRATRAAVGSKDLAIAFQPVVRASGGNVISFHECLVRLRSGDGGLISASSFMPAIERLGLAPLIDRQVLMMTFEALTLHPTARFSVNIFSHTMQDRQWMILFEQAIENDPTLAERLIVEVTETSALLDLGRTQAFLDRLRGHGVTFALDDFGAGHTSLRYLRDLRFDILKIDGRFVREIEHDADNAFLVETMVRIAERFDMMTVAEAVQTAPEARCLDNLGVEFFQGFHFGSPSLILEPTSSPMPAVAAQA